MCKVLLGDGLIISIKICNTQELLKAMLNYTTISLSSIKETTPQPDMDSRIHFLMERWGFTLTDERFG